MAFNIFVLAFAMGGLFFVFGVIYPFIAWLYYPIYRKNGGKKSLKRYMNSL